METIKLKINGQEVTARAGQTILEVVREQGLDEIPTLCHSPELAPYASCFLCTVELAGRGNLVPSCATRVTPGMDVATRSERVIASRRTALELLLSNHYADCVSPCRLGCPAGVDVQGYIALAAMGEQRRALDLIREANPLPAVCGRVCVRKCEAVCRRNEIDQPVGINAIKRFLSDQPEAYDGDVEREPDRGKSVGIVGGGPAGLTAAWFLGRRGYRPVIYEAQPRAGGMLRYGIPAYRLPDDVLDHEIDFIRRAGAEIKYNLRVGKDVTLDELRKRHDALFIAAGAWSGKPMRVAGENETAGVVQGIDFLREKADDPTPIEGTVVVVGGGNTAMDVARTAWRCGAEKVIILYRRTKAEMPADEMEIEDCIAEGIEIIELVAPVGIVASNGKLRALRCIRMKLGEPDSSGRRRPVPLEGSEFDFPCDLAVSAIGQDPLLSGLTTVDGAKVATSRWNAYEVDARTMQTNIVGVFAGGDAAGDGPTVVVDAIRDGQRAARAIDAWLQGIELPCDPLVVTKELWGKPGKAELGEIAETPRHEIHMSPVADRQGNFAEVALGFEPEDTTHEASRCLSCGCVRYDDCALRRYAEQYNVDLKHYAGYVRRHRIDDRHPYIIYDPNKCVLCSRCIRTCSRVLPISALGLVNRGFRTEMRPAMNDPLVETSCIACGNCVDSCPTGALTVKHAFSGRAALEYEELPSHCAVCSLGCQITVRGYGHDRYAIAPSGVPGQYLCRYGRFGYELFVKQQRLVQPTIRSGREPVPASLPDAAQAAADGLRAAVEAHGPEAVAVFVSPELTNEEMYLAARIAREGLGTNNIASLTALETGREAGSLDRVLGFTASSADRSAIATADLIICNNTATESDALILAVDIIEAARRGAHLIVVNSILDTADRILSDVAMDPMRGRTAILWAGVIRAMLESGRIHWDDVRTLAGGDEFVEGLKHTVRAAAEASGIDEVRIRRAGELIGSAQRVVIVHSPDRPEDSAPGDLEMLANLQLILRGTGRSVELLLPRLNSNLAGLEIAGADPIFSPGRGTVNGVPGARTHEELRARLRDGKIRAALIIGEDPLEHARTGAYFQNAEFLAAVDWSETETTRFADVALPSATYLETEGTRCNFEGRVLDFARAVQPPAGISGWQILADIAQRCGVKVASRSAAEITRDIDALVQSNLRQLAPYYWNRGEERVWPNRGRLSMPELHARPASIPPALTHSGRYKRAIRDVGTARFRVH